MMGREYAYYMVQVLEESARSWRVVIDGRTRWLSKVAVRSRLRVGFRGMAQVYKRALEQ